jgi:hypothetical protein
MVSAYTECAARTEYQRLTREQSVPGLINQIAKERMMASGGKLPVKAFLYKYL